uniref:DUF1302 domain-containing protein n=1 Tax=Candidatus Kentrum sp. MB TaxID=2138164 RepID=A0A450XFQ6_9GAMM|nr:MAG: Protein of unknown function (DUF1302) [Candidatus Kentron sp. MB]VFK32967.1 MAG: Protein of unknown function (DUF1302) [Candidatus Kentron sp. MB]VFK75826.1 MAG: Protein of unknown function (DUF1302) [Candidatus Kentron sp. MB]
MADISFISRSASQMSQVFRRLYMLACIKGLRQSLARHCFSLGFAISTFFLFVLPSWVLAIEFDGGWVTGNVDTTVSFGAISRVQERDASIVCSANGGTAHGCNADDGNLNYDTGIVSRIGKVISDVELTHKSDKVGAFFRVRGFVDTRNNSRTDTKRTPLSDRALDLVGRHADLLDAYGWARFDLAGRDGEIRVGKHVLNWGESTFIGGGINAVNPVDMATMRMPGSELREALLPVNMFSLSFDATENLSAEAFYQFDWEKTIAEPAGSYFSTNDFATGGGSQVHLGFGDLPDTGSGAIGAVSRSYDNTPGDAGQWGVAFRYFSKDLNDTEFGLYYMNHHSRLPVISGTAGSAAPVIPPRNYFNEYPEDIDLLGASFNTSLGKWAVQGEYSFKNNAPLQIDDIELLFAASGLPPTLHQLGTTYALNDYVRGYIKRDVSQLQATVSRTFGNIMGANEFIFVTEAAMTHVHGMPSKGSLRLDGPGTFTSGNPYHATGNPGAQHTGKTAESWDHFADATSWGYRLRGRWRYNNAIKGINLLPHMAFHHDVSGVSPGPGGNFIEDRKAVRLGLGATYQHEWEVDLSYTSFFGAGRYNLLNDRDFVAFNLKYSF